MEMVRIQIGLCKEQNLPSSTIEAVDYPEKGRTTTLVNGLTVAQATIILNGGPIPILDRFDVQGSQMRYLNVQTAGRVALARL